MTTSTSDLGLAAYFLQHGLEFLSASIDPMSRRCTFTFSDASRREIELTNLFLADTARREFMRCRARLLAAMSVARESADGTCSQLEYLAELGRRAWRAPLRSA